MQIIEWFQNNWVAISVIILSLHTFLKAIRDAFDKTPQSDDNWYERMVTALGKAVNYLATGKRPV